MPADPSELLRERIAAAIGGRSKALSIEKASLGRFQRSRLQSWIDGKTSPPFDELLEFARWLGKEPSYFFPTGSAGAVVPVQKLDVRAAAGPGAVNGFANVEEELEFPEWMATKLGVARSKLRLLRAHGDSMEPTIANGALLLFELREDASPPGKGRRDPRKLPNDIFVFRMGGDLRVKRIHAAKGGAILISDNPEYDPEFVRGADRDGFKIIGQVVWWCNWL